MKRAQRRGSAGGCHLELLVLHPGKASKKPRPGLANFPESFTTNLDLRTEEGRSWNGNHQRVSSFSLHRLRVQGRGFGPRWGGGGGH